MAKHVTYFRERDWSNCFGNRASRDVYLENMIGQIVWPSRSRNVYSENMIGQIVQTEQTWLRLASKPRLGGFIKQEPWAAIEVKN